MYMYLLHMLVFEQFESLEIIILARLIVAPGSSCEKVSVMQEFKLHMYMIPLPFHFSYTCKL